VRQASNAALEEGLAALETELREEVISRHDELLEQVGSLQQTETSLAGVRGQVAQLQVRASLRGSSTAAPVHLPPTLRSFSLHLDSSSSRPVTTAENVCSLGQAHREGCSKHRSVAQI
jgi:hypothetical protein